MSEKPPPAINLDDPAQRRRMVRVLLVITPFAFVGSFLLAAVQGAQTKHSLIIAGTAVAMCLGAAAAIHVLGSNARVALTVVMVALGLLGFFFG